jgi:hypothetical protein
MQSPYTSPLTRFSAIKLYTTGSTQAAIDNAMQQTITAIGITTEASDKQHRLNPKGVYLVAAEGKPYRKVIHLDKKPRNTVKQLIEQLYAQTLQEGKLQEGKKSSPWVEELLKPFNQTKMAQVNFDPMLAALKSIVTIIFGSDTTEMTQKEAKQQTWLRDKLHTFTQSYTGTDKYFFKNQATLMRQEGEIKLTLPQAPARFRAFIPSL